MRRSVDCEYFQARAPRTDGRLAIDVPASAPHSLARARGPRRRAARRRRELGTLERGESALVPVGRRRLSRRRRRRACRARQSGPAAVCRLMPSAASRDAAHRSRRARAQLPAAARARGAGRMRRRREGRCVRARRRARRAAFAARRVPAVLRGDGGRGARAARDRLEPRSACSKGALAGTVDMLVELTCAPVLEHLEQIERWRGRGRALLHLDTGMNRLGLECAATWRRSPCARTCCRPRARLRHDAPRVRRRAEHPLNARAARALRAAAPPAARRADLDRQLGRHAARCRASRRPRAARNRVVRRQSVQRSREPDGSRRDADGADPPASRHRRARRPSATAPRTSRARRRESPSSASATPTAIRAAWAIAALRRCAAGACPSSGECRWT